MKRCKHLSVVVISVLCLMGFIGLTCLTPSGAMAADKKADTEKKAATEKKAVKKAAVVKKKEPATVVTVVPAAATLAKKVSVVLMGSGFEADKEIRILFTDAEGMQTDIGYALTPEPKTNKAGAFSTTWACDEFIKAKLVAEGVFTLTATDAQFNPLALTPISFAAAKAKTDDKGGKEGKGDKEAKGDKADDKGDKGGDKADKGGKEGKSDKEKKKE